MKSVLLGFSGGMDSTTAARRLRSEGYEVVALTIDTLLSKESIDKAQRIAQELGIEWHLYDARERFQRDIVDYFCQEYASGRTPAPCTRCNTLIKWKILSEFADAMGIEHIATGHYFNIEQRYGRYYVAKGVDPIKDQSYYLWGLEQVTLARALTPMGNIIKSDVRQHFSDKRESMGVCFLQGRPYVEFLERAGISMAEGDIVSEDGSRCGRHNGIARYTIGQKRGVGLTEGYRVIDIDAHRNRIVVGRAESLLKHKLYVTDCNIVDINELLSSRDITIKIRGLGRNPELAVRISAEGDDLVVETQDAAYAPAKGQPLVFYRDNLVVGGGIVVDFE